MNREDVLAGKVSAFRVDRPGEAVVDPDGRRAAFSDWIDWLNPAFGRDRLAKLLRAEAGEVEFAAEAGDALRYLRAVRSEGEIALSDVTGERFAQRRSSFLEVLRATGVVLLEYDVEADELTVTDASGDRVLPRFSQGEYAPLVRAALSGGPDSGSVSFDGDRVWYSLVKGDKSRPLRYAGALIPERLDSLADGALSALARGAFAGDRALPIDRWRIERYRLLGEDTDIVTFDYAPQQDTLIYSLPRMGGGRAEIQINDYLKCLGASRRIAPESHEVVRSAMLRASNSAMSGSFEYRVDFDGLGYRWHRARFVSAADENGCVYRVVGCADEIEREIADRENLMKIALTDGVTGLYNRATAQRFIEHVLGEISGQRYDALFVIDIDDFKRINDTRGHLGGDAALMAVSDAIRAVFREEDIKGRYGGDEFIVYMRGFVDPNLPKAMARRLMNRLYEGEGLVSCSVGAALIAERTDFGEAFARADKALYRAKSASKSCFSMYGE